MVSLPKSIVAAALAAACTACGKPPAPISAPAAELQVADAVHRDHPRATPWWRDAVFYEVFVRSFADSDGDGDGDLQGLISKLDYLNDGDPDSGHDLGVTALWLMPISQSPSYHGYDVVDYFTVNEDYGSNDDFRQLVAAAEARGMRVVVDLVVNHTSDEHPWFRDAVREHSPYHDWYLWAYEGHTYRGPWGQPVWHQLPWWQRGWKHFDCLKYYGVFSPHMPDLDHTNPRVRQAVFEIARFWLHDMGAHGFRLDAARHLVEDGEVQEDTPATHAWLHGFHEHCRGVDPEALVLGEIWTDTETVATYGPDELDLAFQFDLAAAVLHAVNRGTAAPLLDELAELGSLYPDHAYATFLTNHDQNRTMWHLDGRSDKAALAAGVLLTLPGTPFLYYGEEIGMSGRKPDPDLRTPMQWSAEPHGGFSSGRPWRRVRTDFEQVNVASEAADPESLLSTYRRLIHLRRSHPALRTGTLELVSDVADPLCCFYRSLPEETILVVANLGDTALPQDALSGLGGPIRGFDLLGNRMVTLPSASVPANSLSVVQLTSPSLDAGDG